MTSKRAKAQVSNTEGVTYDEQRGILASDLFSACMNRDRKAAYQLIEKGADAWVQAVDGWTALHAAAYAGGDAELVKRLLRDGNAVWNMTDNIGNTAGDVAFSMNYNDIYEFLLEEGVRVEMLRYLMEKADEVASTNDDEDGKSESTVGGDDADVTAKDDAVTSSSSTLPQKLSTASDNQTFLHSKLTFTTINGQDICLDREGNGVMMGWEKPIMVKTAELLTEKKDGLSVLNVGFGLGLIDTELQKYRPARHVIIEPHPDVLEYAKANGWFDKPNVQFFQGTWQQYKEKVYNGDIETGFDAIYFDTYSEHYKDLQEFFEFLPALYGNEEAKFSFFNGLGATSRYFYDIYTVVSELHLEEELMKVTWYDVPVEESFDGLDKTYWNVSSPYRLPIVTQSM